ncbi:MAG: hypothetical protein K0Q79_182 [Flavipsychrobacter sp.]|jgi:hypothetical protein|nr:hypothetical protein [Flavipsychrobacter sp.]
MKKTIQLLSIVLACILIFSACTKKESGNDAAKFIGTWNGTACGVAGNFTLNAGSNGSSLTTSMTVGTLTPGCVKSVTLNITASGNTLTIPSQTFTDNCGVSYTISGGGSLSGTTLTLTENVSGGVTASCTFVGTK